MRCPYCGHIEDKVVDSREAKDGDSIRRRRECLECGRRFTSYERIDEIPYMVVKKDGKRAPFERNKILAGLMRACEKRPISMTQLESIVDEVEKNVQDSPDRELATSEIGKARCGAAAMAPATIASGASSPPIASTAMRIAAR